MDLPRANAMRCAALPLTTLYSCRHSFASVSQNSALTARPAITPGRNFTRVFTSLLILAALFLTTSRPIHALPLTEEEDLPPTHVIANDVVISEVQIAGGSGSYDEFIEIYNPTDASIDLDNWKIQKKTLSGDEYNIIVLPSETAINAHGFFLVANILYSGSVVADAIYTSQNANYSISSNNDLLLYDGSGAIIDQIGWRSTSYTGSDYPFDPISNRSIERKAFYFSDASALAENGVSTRGAHSFYGNSYDSDNAGQDFVRHTSPTVSNPQNRTTSSTERCCTTVDGTLTLQGRANSSGIQVLLWPGSGLRTTTDSSGHFTIPVVPAIAGEDTTAYTVEAIFPGYLSANTTLDLTSTPLSNSPITFPALRLLAGDINADNRINIFDLTIIGSQYGSEGVLAGDVNGDGKVNIQDLSLVSGNFGQAAEQYSWEP